MFDRRSASAAALLMALALAGCEEGPPPPEGDPFASPPGADGGPPPEPEPPAPPEPEAPAPEPEAPPEPEPDPEPALDPECADPGRITIRRLNRVEYDNTVRDLLGDDSRPAQNFPEDDIGYGFDNIGDVLSISPVHVAQYEAAAEALVGRAVEAPAVRTERVYEAEEIGAMIGAAYRGEYWNLWTNGSIDIIEQFPVAGRYAVRVRAFATQAGDEPARMTLALDGAVAETFDVLAAAEAPEWYALEVDIPAGGHTLSVAFVNDFTDPEHPDRALRDRNLIIDAIVIDGPIGEAAPAVVEQVFEAEEVMGDVGGVAGDAWNLWSRGELHVDLNLPHGGEYDLRVRAWGQQAGPDPVRMTIAFDGQLVDTLDVEATRAAPEWYVRRVEAGPGAHTVSVGFINDYYMPDDPDPANRDRNLLIDAIVVEGPFGAVAAPDPAEPAERSPYFVCELEGQDDFGCARQIVSAFATTAWRRPVESDEIDRLMALVRLAREHGDPIIEGIRLAFRGVLLSPHFVYKVELDPDPSSLTPHRLTEHELATRLSYFLWSTMPDDRLRGLADEGRLSDPEVLDAEVQRMLADPKAEALVEHFAGQWLFVRAMHDVAPDYAYFPEFDDLLRGAMIVEATTAYRALVRENAPLTRLMDFETTWLNPRLATHYGIDYETGVEDPEAPPGFRRFDLAGTGRAGVLTLGSTLTVTSFPTRTSPVKRGKWVLEQLMCDEPPPPPPGVEAELGDVDQEAPLRERLAQHRENPDCAVCHDAMDPIGLGLENFDGIGAWRDMMGEHPVDASGVLPDGTAFVGATELADILKGDRRLYTCFQDQIVTYALGSGVDRIRDRGQRQCLSSMADDLDAVDWRMQDVARVLVQSPRFTMRRGEPEPAGEPMDEEGR